MFLKQICILALFTTAKPNSAVVQISNPSGRQLLGHTLIYSRTLLLQWYSKYHLDGGIPMILLYAACFPLLGSTKAAGCSHCVTKKNDNLAEFSMSEKDIRLKYEPL